MKDLEVIVNNADYQQLKDVQQMSPEVQRMKYYAQYGLPKKFGTVMKWVSDDDTIKYCGQYDYNLGFNNKVYAKRTARTGYSYNTVDKTVKIWFNKQINQNNGVVLRQLLLDIGVYDWLYAGCYTMLNNTMLNLVIKGKITNSADLIETYIKRFSTFKLPNPPKHMLSKLASADVDIRNLISDLEVYVEPHAIISRMYNDYMVRQRKHDIDVADILFPNYIVRDLVHQAKQLDRKINLKWSENRLREVHTKWTREIMKYEMLSIPTEEYGYDLDKLELPEGIRLITNNRDLFEEGTIQQHCVYTNYRGSVSAGKYFVATYKNFTVGINKDYGSITYEIQQMYGLRNTPADADSRAYVEAWLAKPEVQQWLETEQIRMKANTNTDDLPW